MYYEPKYFKKEEIFSKAIIKREKDKGNAIWRLMDSRILWTIDQIRERFCGKGNVRNSDAMIVNNWLWGGAIEYRGYRDMILDIIKNNDNFLFSITSQHVFGRAIDYTFRYTTAEEVINDIVKNPNANRYKFITGLELDTTWVHNDVRAWNKKDNGILTFNK